MTADLWREIRAEDPDLAQRLLLAAEDLPVDAWLDRCTGAIEGYWARSRGGMRLEGSAVVARGLWRYLANVEPVTRINQSGEKARHDLLSGQGLITL